jgi:hypothetical protein
VRQTAIVGMISLGLVAGCMAAGQGPTVRPSPTTTAPLTASPLATSNPSTAPTNPLPSATPSPGSSTEWEQRLNDAFGPMDPAFVIRHPESGPTSAPSANGPDPSP